MAIENKELYEVKGPNAHATGKMVDEGFLVLSDGFARKEIAESGKKAIMPVQTRLLKEGVLVDEGSVLRFTKDYQFGSPSGAAGIVLGRTANGWIEWKLAIWSISLASSNY